MKKTGEFLNQEFELTYPKKMVYNLERKGQN
jgi:hypothetical protein